MGIFVYFCILDQFSLTSIVTDSSFLILSFIFKKLRVTRSKGESQTRDKWRLDREELNAQRRRQGGGVSSHDCSGMSVCPWKGHPGISQQAISLSFYLSASLSLSLSGTLSPSYVLITLALPFGVPAIFSSLPRQTFSAVKKLKNQQDSCIFPLFSVSAPALQRRGTSLLRNISCLHTHIIITHTTCSYFGVFRFPLYCCYCSMGVHSHFTHTHTCFHPFRGHYTDFHSFPGDLTNLNHNHHILNEPQL